VPSILIDLLVIHVFALICRDGHLIPKGGELRNKGLVVRVAAMMRDPRPQDLAPRHRLPSIGGLLQEQERLVSLGYRVLV
jgi:hypothetical protein